MNEKELNAQIRRYVKSQGGFYCKIPDPRFDSFRIFQKPFDSFWINSQGRFIAVEFKRAETTNLDKALDKLKDHQLRNILDIDGRPYSTGKVIVCHKDTHQIKRYNAKEVFDYKVSQCTKCHNCNYSVKGLGSKNGIMIIGESPSKKALETGIIFSGKSKEIFEGWLKYIGSFGYSIYRTNLSKCYVQNKDRLTDYLSNCYSSWFLLELKMIQPKLIISLGYNVFNQLTGHHKQYKPGTYLKRMNNKIHIPLYCMSHPMLLVYKPEKEKEIQEQLTKLHSILRRINVSA